MKKILPFTAMLIGLKVTVVFSQDLPKEAHCEPQLDDACMIDNKKVPKADLKKYLPVINADKVSSDGGYCEYPICYDVNDNPVGLRDK